MDLRIDMNHVLRGCEDLQALLSVYNGERYRVSRVCVRTTIFQHDPCFLNYYFDEWSLQQAWQDALNWQADPDDEVEDWQVHRNLHRSAATMISCFGEKLRRHTGVPMPASTTITASAEIPTVGNLAQGRPLSSFGRHSFRAVTHKLYVKAPRLAALAYDAFFPLSSQVPVDILYPDPNYQSGGPTWKVEDCTIGAADNTFVVIQLQFDVLDLFSRILPPPWRPAKRRRGPLDPILPPSSRPPQEDTSERPGHAKSSQFTGVRYRNDNKKWTVEIRRRKNEKKVWIGDFNSEAEAARAIDAAHYHYGKRERLISPDAPELLSARPTPAAPLSDKEVLLNFADSDELLSKRPKPAAGLTRPQALEFVKKEAKWLASIAPKRPCSSSPSARASFEVGELSVRSLAICIEFRSFSEIVVEPATDSADEVGDPVSQLQLAISGTNGIQAMDRDMGAAMLFPMPEDSPTTGATETMVTISGFQMLQDIPIWLPLPLPIYLHWQSSPAPGLQMDDLLDWRDGNVEDISEQDIDIDKIWSTIGQ